MEIKPHQRSKTVDANAPDTGSVISDDDIDRASANTQNTDANSSDNYDLDSNNVDYRVSESYQNNATNSVAERHIEVIDRIPG